MTDRIEPVRRDPRAQPVERVQRVRLLTPSEREAARRERERKRREKSPKGGDGTVDQFG